MPSRIGLLGFSLQSRHNPTSTPDGFLEEREATLEYILRQKKEFTLQMKADKSNRVPGVRSAKSCSSHRAGPGAGLPGEGGGHGKPSLQPLHVQGSRMPLVDARLQQGQGQGLPSSRILSLTPEAKATELEKP